MRDERGRPTPTRRPRPACPRASPSTSVSAVKRTPSSADAPAMRSQTSDRVRGQRKSADATAVTAEREVGEPGGRDVEVHEPLRFALGRVFGRAPEPEQRQHHQRDERRPRRRRARDPRVEQAIPGRHLAHVSSHNGPNASTPIAV